jgi:hypothetical protein
MSVSPRFGRAEQDVNSTYHVLCPERGILEFEVLDAAPLGILDGLLHEVEDALFHAP